MSGFARQDALSVLQRLAALERAALAQLGTRGGGLRATLATADALEAFVADHRAVLDRVVGEVWEPGGGGGKCSLL
jgi:hypothetical protein